jgi:hypothetical protein
MQHQPSKDDLAFRTAFETGTVAPGDFTHRAHLRLAYICLCESDVETAATRIRSALKAFLARNNVDPSKYHETLTLAWLKAVRHFMARARDSGSFDTFLSKDDRLLDTDIMLTHYARETLFSDVARNAFVMPDLQAIPSH